MTISTSKQAQPTVDESLQSFRGALEDVISVAEALQPHCTETLDLIGVVKLALQNECQFKMLLSLVTAQAKKP